jgi:hypothetical protein
MRWRDGEKTLVVPRYTARYAHPPLLQVLEPDMGTFTSNGDGDSFPYVLSPLAECVVFGMSPAVAAFPT